MKKTCAIILFLSVFISCKEEKTTTVPSVNNDTGNKVTAIAPSNSFNPYASIDISPMDMSYYPVDYPKLKMTGKIRQAPLARVIYSRPHLQGRKLFKDVLKYGEPWRLGANEATEIQFFRDVVIQGKRIKAGRYVLYSIPQENMWTIHLNSNNDTWGLKPDQSKDDARFKVVPKITSQPIEYFTIVFEDQVTGPELLIAWDDLEARLPLKFE